APLEILLLDSSQTNFSGWRGAMDQARERFRQHQRWLIRRLHAPVYHWKLRQWQAADAAFARRAEVVGPALLRHRWNPPGWPYIEPLKDASADLMRLRNVLTSPRRLHAQRGADWDDIWSEAVEDNAKEIRAAKQAAIAMNAEIADQNPVHWRELLSLPTPDGLTVSVAAGLDREAEPAAAAEVS
ncbi:MAG: hypothetical protein PHF00_11550, partial [Elusimicrobia bacterium]|nr:hypothetical protein [Elusimicrobiota bacterium]